MVVNLIPDHDLAHGIRALLPGVIACEPDDLIGEDIAVFRYSKILNNDIIGVAF